MSISGDKVGDPAHHFDPDEMGEIMWEMRPRFATSAGELKRRKKKEMLAERDRKEVSAYICTGCPFWLVTRLGRLGFESSPGW